MRKELLHHDDDIYICIDGCSGGADDLVKDQETKGTGKRKWNPDSAPLFIAFPLMMMSVYQLMHIPGQTYELPAFWELLVAGLLGALFGYVILLHTAYERRDDGLIYPKPNQYFKYIIIAIILIRVVLTQYLSSLGTTEISMLAITMALVYISIWRIGSFIKFRRTLSV